MELQRFYKKLKLFKLKDFLVNNNKCKTIQPLCGMELQRVYKKIKVFKLTYFLVKYTNYKAIQPLCGMKLRRFYMKEISVGTCIAHEATLI